MRIKLTSILLLIISIGFSQDKFELKNQDGVFITCELTKLSNATDKKDKYLFSIKAENKNDYSVYYEVPVTITKIGDLEFESYGNKNFAEVNARNSIGFLSSSTVSITGQETKLRTNDSKALYTIPKGEFITTESNFSFNKDEKPIITGIFFKSMRKLDFFDISISETFINGDWASNCGSISMTLALIKNTQNESILQQTVNGKINEWKKINANSFEKVSDKNVTLTYNKQNQTFVYSTTDGVSCVWTKK
jgi:hypothetical protein